MHSTSNKVKNDFLRKINETASKGRIAFHPILMHFAARFIGKTYGEFASDHKVLVEANIRCLEHFDLDMVSLISDPYRETSAFGGKVSFPAENVPRCEDLVVKSMEDVRNLKRPDVYKSERTLDRIKGAELYAKRLKGKVPVIGWIEGPLAEACDLAGVSEMLMQLMTDYDFSNLILDKCTVTAKDFALAQINAGCDIIGIGDAICSQIDKSTYDAFLKHRHREIIDFIHEKGGLVKLHICGEISHILSSIKEVGVDILDLDYDVDMDNAWELTGKVSILSGNINPVIIQDRSADEVEEISRSFIKKHIQKDIIYSAGCEITVNTPPENLMAMRKASLNSFIY